MIGIEIDVFEDEASELISSDAFDASIEMVKLSATLSG
jgi:hypothetical protein